MMISVDQKNKIKELRTQLGMSEPEFNKMLKDVFGVTSILWLNSNDAGQVIRSLEFHLSLRNSSGKLIKKSGMLDSFLSGVKSVLKAV